MCDEIAKVADDATDEETDRARAQLKASILMARESSSSRAEQVARQLMVFGRPLDTAEIVERIEAVDAEAVRRRVRVVQARAPPVAPASSAIRFAAGAALAPALAARLPAGGAPPPVAGFALFLFRLRGLGWRFAEADAHAPDRPHGYGATGAVVATPGSGHHSSADRKHCFL